MKLIRNIWQDETGVITTTDLILASTILVIGAIVGLTTLRDQVVQELGDMAAAVGALDQGYGFAGATVGGFTVAGSTFVDTSDSCETGLGEGDCGNEPVGSPAICINVCQVAATGESGS
jgi:hypothetical protein